MRKEIGLLIYMMGVLMVASTKRFGFKEDVYPSYHHTVFDNDRLREKLLKLEKQMAFGPISKRNEDGSSTVTKPKRNWKYSVKVKMLEMKYALKTMPNYRTHEEVNAYIRKRTMEILNKYYNMEESDFHVNFEGRIKMVGEKKVVAADWVYRKYGIVNPKPTFLRTLNELGDEIYVIECPPEWEDVVSIDGYQYWEDTGRIKKDELIIFAPLDFGEIMVKLRAPSYIKMIESITIGSVTLLSMAVSPFFSPFIIFGLAKVSPLSGNIRYDQLTNIYNMKDYGVLGDGSTDDTPVMDAQFTAKAGNVLFYPNSTYIVERFPARGAVNYEGPYIQADTTFVGEGDGTLFQTTQNGLQFFLYKGNNIQIRDMKIEGTAVAHGSSDGAGISGQNLNDNLLIDNVTSDGHVGNNNINGRGISIIGTSIGAIVQNCRMDSNQHGIVVGAPDPCVGVRLLSCYANDGVERGYYLEGEQLGTIMMSCVSNGTGAGCYVYYGVDNKGASFTANVFLSDGNGMEPYQGVTYTHQGVTWTANISQSGNYGMYPQCSRSTFTGNILTYNTSYGYYSFTRFTHNIVNNNVISMNSDTGMYLHNDSDDNDYIGNQIIDNIGTGVYFRAGNNNRFFYNKVYSSDTGVYHASTGLWIDDTQYYLHLKDNDLRSAGALIYYIEVGTILIWGDGNQTEAWA